ncbi:MAG: FAD-dependent oxidoreductase [Planctomycetes bacterium]|nr:FAD-dependent oxidoreductase [Planctomycetota bacterium]
MSKIKVIPTTLKVKQLPPTAISMSNMLFNKTGSWRNYKPEYNEKLPPCNAACPSGEKIQGYLYLVKNHKFAEAWQLLKQDNPLPAVCGRVCFHPCEVECNRGDYDESIGIHNVERIIGDYGLKHNLRVKTGAKRKQQIAIIGGGPAGISCAYHLAKMGYKPTIFEAERQLGGMLQYGIPSYRLPKNILQKEINSIIKMGVKVKTGMRVGKNLFIEELANKYHAVLIATGAYKERALDIPGEETRGVIGALDFLHEVNSGKKPKISKDVVIIGGGNAAMDAARSALRMGAHPKVIYRRTRNEMPAIPDEIRDTEEEKIDFVFLAAPVKVISKNNKVVAIECIKMKLGSADSSGRRKPIPVKGSNFRIKTGTIIKAIGESPETSFIPASLLKDNLVCVDKWGMTAQNNIFAAGDTVTGPKTVVEAIGAGKRSAQAIDKYVRTGTVSFKEVPEIKPVRFEQLNTAYFEHAPRVSMPHLEFKERVKSTKEVYLGYKPNDAITESDRCFSCGVCNFCDNCWVFCPDMAVIKKKSKPARQSGGYEFNYDYCKGCGICASECPRNVISLVEEKK